MKTLDIEIAALNYLDYRKNLIVPNISTINGLVAFETDLLLITKNSMAYGYEIKVSLSDLKADFKKDQYKYMNTSFKEYYGVFKYFSYIVPTELVDKCLELVPEKFGVYECLELGNKNIIRIRRSPKHLFTYKWSDKDILKVAKLGAMRIYKLKQKLNEER